MNNAWMNLSASLLLCTSCNFSLCPIIVYCLVPINNWNKRAYARKTRKKIYTLGGGGAHFIVHYQSGNHKIAINKQVSNKTKIQRHIIFFSH